MAAEVRFQVGFALLIQHLAKSVVFACQLLEFLSHLGQVGLVDLELHQTWDPDDESKTPFDIQAEVAKKTSVMKPLDEDQFLCSFSHIFAGGYAAGYYSYKWAEVLSADAFSAFEDVGLDQEDKVAEVGKRYRDTILSFGGSEHPMEVFKKFRGREPDTSALLRHSGLSVSEQSSAKGSAV